MLLFKIMLKGGLDANCREMEKVKKKAGGDEKGRRILPRWETAPLARRKNTWYVGMVVTTQPCTLRLEGTRTTGHGPSLRKLCAFEEG